MIHKVFDNIHLYISQASDGNLVSKYGEKEAKFNREEIYKKVGIRRELIYEGEQVHSGNIKIIKKNAKNKKTNYVFSETDGLVTNLKNTFLLLKIADCLPIFYFDKKKKVIALVHAGWRGLDKNIHIKAVKILKEELNCKIKNISVYIGPHIKKCCYYYPSFPFSGKKKWQDYLKKKQGLISCDLTKFTLDSLKKQGIVGENISVSKSCTACSKEFFSHYKLKKENKKNKLFCLMAVVRSNP